MSIPDYQTVMLPLLKLASDKREHSVPGLVDALASEFKLSDPERRELLPSGGQFVFDNRVGWARTYLKKAGLLAAPKRGFIQITDRGLHLLKENPSRIDNRTLRRFPEFLEFQSVKTEETKESSEMAEELDPQEKMEAGYQRIRKQLSSELLTRIKGCSPAFFERLVVELLLKMGYGGSRKDFGEAVGKPGDRGIDAVIKEDKLGLDMVYIQAKRWDTSQVGSKKFRRLWARCTARRLARCLYHDKRLLETRQRLCSRYSGQGNPHQWCRARKSSDRARSRCFYRGYL